MNLSYRGATRRGAGMVYPAIDSEWSLQSQVGVPLYVQLTFASVPGKLTVWQEKYNDVIYICSVFEREHELELFDLFNLGSRCKLLCTCCRFV